MFPEIEPYYIDHLKVSEIHNLYIEQSGNPNGIPVLFLHGGPGAGCSDRHRRFFDPEFYRIIMFDQRGAGRSKPSGETSENTLPLLIEDIEKIRIHLNIEHWLIFGGSWGSTLGIAYGIEYPEYCLGFILRGIFLMRPLEIQWFMVQIQFFHPEHWNDLINKIENLSGEKFPERFTISYLKILEVMQRIVENNESQDVEDLFTSFCNFEDKIMTLLPTQSASITKKIMAVIGKIQHFYFLNNMKSNKNLLPEISRIAHLPCIIVQGRYDLVCPPLSAYELHQIWRGSILNIVPDGNHSANDAPMEEALIRAVEDFKSKI